MLRHILLIMIYFTPNSGKQRFPEKSAKKPYNLSWLTGEMCLNKVLLLPLLHQCINFVYDDASMAMCDK